jgi:hypothetical protein
MTTLASTGEQRKWSLLAARYKAGASMSGTPDAAPRSPPLASRRRRERSQFRVDWTAAPAPLSARTRSVPVTVTVVSLVGRIVRATTG